jgi:signal transduction histidine kinase
MFVCDIKGEIIFVNAAAQRLAQIEPEDDSRKFAQNLLATLLDPAGLRITQKKLPWMKAVHGEVIVQKYSLVRPEARLRTLLLAIWPITLSQGVIGAVGSLVDITQRKQAGDFLLENALERQRSRIAADVHDTISQDLTAIGLQLQSALEAVEDEFSTNLVQARDRLLSAQRAARRSLAEVRRSIWMLSHDAFEGENLRIALSSMSRHLFDGTPIMLELALCDEPRSLTPDARRELVRIGKEALGNVLKHSRASTVRIALVQNRQGLELSISDNGQGFAPTSLSKEHGREHGGIGLSSMRMRAAQLGGTFAIDSAPGEGARVFVFVPLPLEPIPASRRQTLPIH